MADQNPNNCSGQDPNPPEVEAQFPEGSTPQPRMQEESSLCYYGLTPLVVTGIIRHILGQHFGDARNILNHRLRAAAQREGVWRGDGSPSAFYIESIHQWDVARAEQRPALIIKEGEWRWQRLGVGNRKSIDTRTGTVSFDGLWTGSHVVFAIAEEGAATQILATEVMKCLLWHSDQIRNSFGFQHFEPISIGSVSALKESTENYVVPVTIGYAVPETWEVTEEAPRLKQVIFRTSQTHQWY